MWECKYKLDNDTVLEPKIRLARSRANSQTESVFWQGETRTTMI
jgi:hypothetical protein